MKNLKLPALLLIYSLLFLLPNSSSPAFAFTCTSGNSPIVNGLATTPTLGQNLVTSSGACIVNDPKATFAPYKIPSYDDLKSLYYTQAKTTSSVTKHDPITPGLSDHGNVNTDLVDLTGTKDHLYFINGNLIYNSASDFPQNPAAATKRVGVVFVQGNFYIQNNINYTGGLVFVVKGNVNITSSVTTINAVIISSGIIYTAGSGCTLAGNAGTNNQLVINGSLVSINPDDAVTAIHFCRNLADNNSPAELINLDVKYLVILRNLMSDTFQKWSETQ